MTPKYGRVAAAMIEDIRREMRRLEQNLERATRGMLVPVRVSVRAHRQPARVVGAYTYTRWRKP